MSGVICRFEGCVNTGSRATFQQQGETCETLLCSGHVKHVHDSLLDPTKAVLRDRNGRISVEKAPPLHDHEIEAARVRGLLDTTVNVAVKRHTLEPGGTADGRLLFLCIPCEKGFINSEAMLSHLKAAADAALAKPAESKE